MSINFGGDSLIVLDDSQTACPSIWKPIRRGRPLGPSLIAAAGDEIEYGQVTLEKWTEVCLFESSRLVEQVSHRRYPEHHLVSTSGRIGGLNFA